MAGTDLAETSSDQQVFLGRQSIVDRGQNLVAFELLFRSSSADSVSVNDDFTATVTVINRVLNEFGLESVLGKYLGFFKVDASLIMSDMIELLPRDRVVLDILGSVEINPTIIERCRQLKQMSYSLSLSDCPIGLQAVEPLMPMLDFVKLDGFVSEDSIAKGIVLDLKNWPVQLVAKKVETYTQAQVCLDLGFDLLQGYYFARPNLISGKRTPHSHAALMRLLGLVLADANDKDIEVFLKTDPGLTLNLLRLANSAATNPKREITLPHDAILILGRHRLQRYLQLLLYANSNKADSFPSPLLQLVATRGRLMELLALETAPGDKEFGARAFMTGIMSLVDTLMDQPIAEALAPLNLAADISAAILRHEGPLGKLLLIAEALDRSDFTDVSTTIAEFARLTLTKLSVIQAESLSWANSLASQTAT